MRKILPTLLCLSLAACGDGGLEPRPMGISTLAFSHTGIGTRPAGAYSAVGEVEMQGDGIPPGEWAFRMRSGPAPQPLLVQASRPAANGRYDRVTMFLPRGVTAGQTLQFGVMCETSPTCANMSIVFGLHPELDAPEVLCSVWGGELRLTTLTSRRAAGTFTGTADCFGTASGETQVTSGAFDVALVAPPG